MNEFAVGELIPKRQTISRFKRVGQVVMPIVNRSNSRAKFRLEGADQAGACYFEFQVPGEAAALAQLAELWLGPGEAVAVPTRVTLPPTPVIGPGKSTYHFTLTTTLLSGTYPSRSILGHLARPPLIGPWLSALVVTCLVTLLFYLTPLLFVQPAVDPGLAQVNETDLTVQAAAKSAIVASKDNTSSPDPDAPEVKARSEMSYEEIFQEIGPQYDLDWRLLAEVAYQESRMDHLAIGQDSDLGLMQIIPATWYEWAPKVGVTDPFDPYSNVLVAAAYLAYVRDYAGSRGYHEEYWMLLGYNWGPNNLRRLFDGEEAWSEIPERRHRYALEILQARVLGLERWQTALTLSAP